MRRVTWMMGVMGLAMSAGPGCMTMTGARPLQPGEHQVGATLGGPLLVLGAPLPLPQLTLEGRHGVTRLGGRALDVNYGLGVTPLALGIVQVHAGGSYQLWESASGFGLSVTDRIFFATNALTRGEREPGARGVWGLNQTELLASQRLGEQLVYGGLAQYLDFGEPQLLLTPVLGGVLDVGKAGGLVLQIESRYYAINQTTEVNSVDWFPAGRGALGVSVGVGYTFGACTCEE